MKRTTSLSLSSFLALAAAVGSIACPKGKGTTAPRPRARAVDPAKLEPQLGLPAGPAGRTALVLLARAAKGGDPRAAVVRLHYLFDLYDFARLTGDTPARNLVWQALGLKGRPSGGRTTTMEVVGRLRRAAQELKAGLVKAAAVVPPPRRPRPKLTSRQDQILVGLLGLLKLDWDFLGTPSFFATRLTRLRKLARVGGPLAYAAQLRLYAHCAQAFRAAAAAPPSMRLRILDHCLYAMDGVDPRLHLRRGSRTPTPPWSAYRRDLARRLALVAKAGPRPAALSARLAERDRDFFVARRQRLPLDPSPLLGQLTALEVGRSYRGHSVVVALPDQLLGSGGVTIRPVEKRYRSVLSDLFFAQQRRTHLVLLASPQVTLKRLLPILRFATETGFYSVGLGGLQRLTKAPGYWARTGAPPPYRLRELVLSLVPASKPAATLRGVSKVPSGWFATADGFGLAVHLGPRGVIPYGADGQLPLVTHKDGLVLALRAALTQLREAFPAASSLVVSASKNLRYDRWLWAVAQLRSDRALRQQWPRLGLRLLGPRRSGKENIFAARVQIRLAAKLKLVRWPRNITGDRDLLADVMRPCYLKALDRVPARWGHFEVTSSADKTLVNQLRGTSPEEATLNQCLAKAVGLWRRAQRVTGPLRFRIQLRPR